MEMKSDLNAALRWIIVLSCVFAPFLVVLAALSIVPSGLTALKITDGVDWIWFALLGGMMLGVYYFLAVYLKDEEEITMAFHTLDLDNDGFIGREEAKSWPALSDSFERFDADRDGRLSRVEFEAFEHSIAVR
jgi:hypothetical protein